MTKVVAAIAAAIAVFLLFTCLQIPSIIAGNNSTVLVSESASAAPVAAIAAYWQMYKSAYKWAPDQVLLRLEPKDVPALSSGGGKADIWEATFASPSKHECRQFMYAVTAHPPDIYQGVNVGHAIPWSGATRDAMPIEKAQFTVDSDTAFSTAAADAQAWLKKNPDKKLSSFQLGYGYSLPAPVWYIVWGDKKSGYVAYVNATTGKVMKKM
jgi:hypothetical protein